MDSSSVVICEMLWPYVSRSNKKGTLWSRFSFLLGILGSLMSKLGHTFFFFVENFILRARFCERG